jgi:hypothetical protein
MHFTYCQPENEHLLQGDVLRKSEQIRGLLQQVHPHYLKEDYTHFIVLTQSCDLVRRRVGTKSPVCGARYITVAAVRPLEVVLRRYIERFQDELAIAAGVCGRRSRDAVKRFVEHLLNNNDRDFFYLHEEPGYGFPESSCAFLQLSISIRAYEHYEECLEARIMSLDPVFRAKLGWMTGNIYSRIGTDDWVPGFRTKEEFGATVEEMLDLHCKWVDDKKIKEAAKQIDEGTRQKGSEAIRSYIEELPVKNRKQEAIARILELLEELKITSPGDEAKVRRLLENDSALTTLIPK